MKKQGKQNTNSNDFRTVWKVNAGDDMRLATRGNHTIDWGDGCIEQVKDKDKVLKHTYVKKGEYTVAISPGVTRFWSSQDTAKKLIEIKQWGRAQWESMESMFDGARNMVCTATDTPDLSKVEDMSHMFSCCSKFNSPIEHWDTKRVTDIRNMLSRALTFNRSLANMDFRNVVTADRLLYFTPAFDQDLRDLKIGNKANTDHLFGQNKSLAQYNEQHAERFDAQDEKHDVYSALNG